jgi:hypothetical protein
VVCWNDLKMKCNTADGLFAKSSTKAFDLFSVSIRKNFYYPRFCSRPRSEATQTEAKRVVGAVLRRRHNHNYVEEQNSETSVAARICKP